MKSLFPFVLAVTACNTSGPESPVTFQGDIRPIVETRCTTCHQPGGVGTIDFTDASAWKDGSPVWAELATQAVASGRMPPWMPADDCHPIEDARGLTEAERQTFASWADGDYQPGKADDYVAPEPVLHPMPARQAEWGAADLVLSGPEAYQIKTERPDDYRCIIMDHEFTNDTWVRGVEVRPDQRAFVHHLILYQFDAEQVADLETQDAEDPDLGYACFNNPDATTVMAWAPGQNGEFLPEDMGRYVKAGSKWVLQIHYNTLGRNAADVPADRTTVGVWENLTPPSQALLTIPFPNGEIAIPAGDPHVVQKSSFNLGELPFDLPVIGVMGHMHQLGTAISLSATRDGEKTCLLDIPKWDFSWQQTYYFPEDQWFYAGGDTTANMTCVYDNSAANQIVVNGVAREPQDVYWGENTTDEMCLTYLLAALPAAVVTSF